MRVGLREGRGKRGGGVVGGVCASKISIKLLCSLYFLVVQWEGTGMRWVKVEGCEPMDFWKIVFMFVGGCECVGVC